MWNHKSWSKPVSYLPKYTLMEAVAAQEPPEQIQQWEASEEFTTLCEQRARNLVTSLGAAPRDHALFYSFTLPAKQGIATVLSRSGLPQRCAVFFSTHTRAALYADLLLAGVELKPVEFTAAELVKVLNGLAQIGITHFVLDRCPRCWNFPVTPSASVQTEEAAIAHWSFVKAIEQTRANYYYKVARHRAAAGDWTGSRNIALMAVAHVTPDDPRFHSLLAEAAIKLDDKLLGKEAKDAMRIPKEPSRLETFLNSFEWHGVDSALKI